MRDPRFANPSPLNSSTNIESRQPDGNGRLSRLRRSASAFHFILAMQRDLKAHLSVGKPSRPAELESPPGSSASGSKLLRALQLHGEATRPKHGHSNVEITKTTLHPSNSPYLLPGGPPGGHKQKGLATRHLSKKPVEKRRQQLLVLGGEPQEVAPRRKAFWRAPDLFDTAKPVSQAEVFNHYSAAGHSQVGTHAGLQLDGDRLENAESLSDHFYIMWLWKLMRHSIP